MKPARFARKESCRKEASGKEASGKEGWNLCLAEGLLAGPTRRPPCRWPACHRRRASTPEAGADVTMDLSPRQP